MDALSNHPPLADRLAIAYEYLAAELAAALDGVAVAPIQSDADVEAARNVVKPLKTLGAKVEMTRKAEKAPILADGETVDGFFADLRKELDAIVAGITKAATDYQTIKREEARKLEAAKARIAKAVGDAAPVPVAPRETVRVSTSSGVAASGRVTWDYEVTDAAALPRELMTPNKDAIKAKVAGLKATLPSIDAASVPGLRIFERIGTTWR